MRERVTRRSGRFRPGMHPHRHQIPTPTEVEQRAEELRRHMERERIREEQKTMRDLAALVRAGIIPARATPLRGVRGPSIIDRIGRFIFGF